MMNWIPCDESLPPFNWRVIVWVPTWGTAREYLRSQGAYAWEWVDSGGSTLEPDEVSHWMHMPDGPP